MDNYTIEEQTNAKEIATTLKDYYSMPTHLQFVRQYKLSFLWEMVRRAMSIPEHKVTNSRGAIYVSNVKRYGNSPDTWN